MTAPQPSSTYHVVQTETEGTTLSKLSLDIVGSQTKQHHASSHLAMADLQEHEQRQDVPKYAIRSSECQSRHLILCEKIDFLLVDVSRRRPFDELNNHTHFY